MANDGSNDEEPWTIEAIMALPTAEQRLAARRELQQWSNARADARRGRPLQPGDISRVKGRIPTITTLVRSADERKDDIR